MNAKRIITLLALLAILVLGLKGAPFFNVSSLTYDGSGTDVTELYDFYSDIIELEKSCGAVSGAAPVPRRTGLRLQRAAQRPGADGERQHRRLREIQH